MISSYRGKIALCALATSTVMLGAASARAELMLYDKDGWTLKHDGLAQGFYMFSRGDVGPDGDTAAAMGPGPKFVDFFSYAATAGNREGKFTSSRFRAGWTGGRFNWVAEKVMSPQLKASAHLGVAYSISTDDAPTASNNKWDVRNGFLNFEGPWGDVTIGRSVGLYTLGAIISTINNTSAAMGLGNTCGSTGDDLSCYTSAYGVKFPGFWAGIYYQTPSLGGLKIKVAALDPESAGAESVAGGVRTSTLYSQRPLPMFQLLARYEGDFGVAKLVPYFNGFWQRAGISPTVPEALGLPESVDPLGGGVGADLFIASLTVGAGVTLEHGTSFGGPLYGSEVVDGAGKLRNGTSFYAHGRYSFDGVVDVGIGYGQTGLQRSTFDEANQLNINKFRSNIYGSVQYHLDPLTFVAELNVLKHKWHGGNTQDVQVVSLGANFAY